MVFHLFRLVFSDLLAFSPIVIRIFWIIPITISRRRKSSSSLSFYFLIAPSSICYHRYHLIWINVNWSVNLWAHQHCWLEHGSLEILTFPSSGKDPIFICLTSCDRINSNGLMRSPFIRTCPIYNDNLCIHRGDWKNQACNENAKKDGNFSFCNKSQRML